MEKEDLQDFEKLVETSFHPVIPRPEFVFQLHQRLTDPKRPTVRFPRKATSQFLLFITLGVIGGAIFIVTVTRLIKALLDLMRGAK